MEELIQILETHDPIQLKNLVSWLRDHHIQIMNNQQEFEKFFTSIFQIIQHRPNYVNEKDWFKAMNFLYALIIASRPNPDMIPKLFFSINQAQTYSEYIVLSYRSNSQDLSAFEDDLHSIMKDIRLFTESMQLSQEQSFNNKNETSIIPDLKANSFHLNFYYRNSSYYGKNILQIIKRLKDSKNSHFQYSTEIHKKITDWLTFLESSKGKLGNYNNFLFVQQMILQIRSLFSQNIIPKNYAETYSQSLKNIFSDFAQELLNQGAPGLFIHFYFSSWFYFLQKGIIGPDIPKSILNCFRSVTFMKYHDINSNFDFPFLFELCKQNPVHDKLRIFLDFTANIIRVNPTLNVVNIAYKNHDPIRSFSMFLSKSQNASLYFMQLLIMTVNNFTLNLRKIHGCTFDSGNIDPQIIDSINHEKISFSSQFKDKKGNNDKDNKPIYQDLLQFLSTNFEKKVYRDSKSALNDLVKARKRFEKIKQQARVILTFQTNLLNAIQTNNIQANSIQTNNIQTNNIQNQKNSLSILQIPIIIAWLRFFISAMYAENEIQTYITCFDTTFSSDVPLGKDHEKNAYSLPKSFISQSVFAYMNPNSYQKYLWTKEINLFTTIFQNLTNDQYILLAGEVAITLFDSMKEQLITYNFINLLCQFFGQTFQPPIFLSSLFSNLFQIISRHVNLFFAPSYNESNHFSQCITLLLYLGLSFNHESFGIYLRNFEKQIIYSPLTNFKCVANQNVYFHVASLYLSTKRCFLKRQNLENQWRKMIQDQAPIFLLNFKDDIQHSQRAKAISVLLDLVYDAPNPSLGRELSWILETAIKEGSHMNIVSAIDIISQLINVPNCRIKEYEWLKNEGFQLLFDKLLHVPENIAEKIYSILLQYPDHFIPNFEKQPTKSCPDIEIKGLKWDLFRTLSVATSQLSESPDNYPHVLSLVITGFKELLPNISQPNEVILKTIYLLLQLFFQCCCFEELKNATNVYSSQLAKTFSQIFQHNVSFVIPIFWFLNPYENGLHCYAYRLLEQFIDCLSDYKKKLELLQKIPDEIFILFNYAQPINHILMTLDFLFKRFPNEDIINLSHIKSLIIQSSNSTIDNAFCKKLDLFLKEYIEKVDSRTRSDFITLVYEIICAQSQSIRIILERRCREISDAFVFKEKLSTEIVLSTEKPVLFIQRLIMLLDVGFDYNNFQLDEIIIQRVISFFELNHSNIDSTSRVVALSLSILKSGLYSTFTKYDKFNYLLFQILHRALACQTHSIYLIAKSCFEVLISKYTGCKFLKQITDYIQDLNFFDHWGDPEQALIFVRLAKLMPKNIPENYIERCFAFISEFANMDKLQKMNSLPFFNTITKIFSASEYFTSPEVKKIILSPISRTKQLSKNVSFLHQFLLDLISLSHETEIPIILMMKKSIIKFFSFLFNEIMEICSKENLNLIFFHEHIINDLILHEINHLKSSKILSTITQFFSNNPNTIDYYSFKVLEEMSNFPEYLSMESFKVLIDYLFNHLEISDDNINNSTQFDNFFIFKRSIISIELKLIHFSKDADRALKVASLFAKEPSTLSEEYSLFITVIFHNNLRPVLSNQFPMIKLSENNSENISYQNAKNNQTQSQKWLKGSNDQLIWELFEKTISLVYSKNPIDAHLAQIVVPKCIKFSSERPNQQYLEKIFELSQPDKFKPIESALQIFYYAILKYNIRHEKFIKNLLDNIIPLSMNSCSPPIIIRVLKLARVLCNIHLMPYCVYDGIMTQIFSYQHLVAPPFDHFVMQLIQANPKYFSHPSDNFLESLTFCIHDKFFGKLEYLPKIIIFFVQEPQLLKCLPYSIICTISSLTEQNIKKCMTQIQTVGFSSEVNQIISYIIYLIRSCVQLVPFCSPEEIQCLSHMIFQFLQIMVIKSDQKVNQNNDLIKDLLDLVISNNYSPFPFNLFKFSNLPNMTYAMFLIVCAASKLAPEILIDQYKSVCDESISFIINLSEPTFNAFNYFIGFIFKHFSIFKESIVHLVNPMIDIIKKQEVNSLNPVLWKKSCLFSFMFQLIQYDQINYLSILWSNVTESLAIYYLLAQSLPNLEPQKQFQTFLRLFYLFSKYSPYLSSFVDEVLLSTLFSPPIDIKVLQKENRIIIHKRKSLLCDAIKSYISSNLITSQIKIKICKSFPEVLFDSKFNVLEEYNQSFEELSASNESEYSLLKPYHIFILLIMAKTAQNGKIVLKIHEKLNHILPENYYYRMKYFVEEVPLEIFSNSILVHVLSLISSFKPISYPFLALSVNNTYQDFLYQFFGYTFYHLIGISPEKSKEDVTNFYITELFTKHNSGTSTTDSIEFHPEFISILKQLLKNVIQLKSIFQKDYSYCIQGIIYAFVLSGIQINQSLIAKAFKLTGNCEMMRNFWVKNESPELIFIMPNYHNDSLYAFNLPKFNQDQATSLALTFLSHYETASKLYETNNLESFKHVNSHFLMEHISYKDPQTDFIMEMRPFMKLNNTPDKAFLSLCDAYLHLESFLKSSIVSPEQKEAITKKANDSIINSRKTIFKQIRKRNVLLLFEKEKYYSFFILLYFFMLKTNNKSISMKHPSYTNPDGLFNPSFQEIIFQIRRKVERIRDPYSWNWETQVKKGSAIIYISQYDGLFVDQVSGWSVQGLKALSSENISKFLEEYPEKLKKSKDNYVFYCHGLSACANILYEVFLLSPNQTPINFSLIFNIYSHLVKLGNSKPAYLSKSAAGRLILLVRFAIFFAKQSSIPLQDNSSITENEFIKIVIDHGKIFSTEQTNLWMLWLNEMVKMTDQLWFFDIVKDIIFSLNYKSIIYAKRFGLNNVVQEIELHQKEQSQIIPIMTKIQLAFNKIFTSEFDNLIDGTSIMNFFNETLLLSDSEIEVISEKGLLNLRKSVLVSFFEKSLGSLLRDQIINIYHHFIPQSPSLIDENTEKGLFKSFVQRLHEMTTSELIHSIQEITHANRDIKTLTTYYTNLIDSINSNFPFVLPVSFFEPSSAFKNIAILKILPIFNQRNCLYFCTTNSSKQEFWVHKNSPGFSSLIKTFDSIFSLFNDVFNNSYNTRSRSIKISRTANFEIGDNFVIDNLPSLPLSFETLMRKSTMMSTEQWINENTIPDHSEEPLISFNRVLTEKGQEAANRIPMNILMLIISRMINLRDYLNLRLPFLRSHALSGALRYIFGTPPQLPDQEIICVTNGIIPVTAVSFANIMPKKEWNCSNFRLSPNYLKIFGEDFEGEFLLAWGAIGDSLTKNLNIFHLAIEMISLTTLEDDEFSIQNLVNDRKIISEKLLKIAPPFFSDGESTPQWFSDVMKVIDKAKQPDLQPVEIIPWL